MTSNPTEKIEETETGYRLTIKSKRGTGTRDEDTVSATAKTETFDQLSDDARRLTAVVSSVMDNRRVHQPDSEGDDA